MLSTTRKEEEGTSKADITQLVALLVAALVIALLATIAIPVVSGQQAAANLASAVESGDLGQTASTMEVAPLTDNAYNPTRTGCYWFDTATGTITGYESGQAGCGTDVRIPSQLDGVDVRTIGYGAFHSLGITSVTFPNSLRSIAYGAFENNNLTSLKVPNSVTTIEEYAFQDNRIATLTLGSSVMSIGSYAFSGSNLTSVVIPNSVRTIEFGAFWDNNLSSLTIPHSVRHIGDRAFQENSLTSAQLPAHTAYVGPGNPGDWTGKISSFDEGVTVTGGSPF